MIAARGGVTRDIPAGEAVLGAPAEPHDRAIRALTAARRLPELVEEVRALRKKVTLLCEKCGIEETPKND